MPLTTYNPTAFTGPAASTVAESVSVSGDANPRFTKTVDGTMKWGGGSAATDCTLNRSGVGTLAFNGLLTVGGLQSSGDITSFGAVRASDNVYVNGATSVGTGDGLVSIANASTPPTTAPTGGGLLYAKSGVPLWRDSGNQTVGMVRTYSADCTTRLTVTTTEADIVGASVSVVVTGSNATVVFESHYDFQGSGATISGIPNWNGSDLTQQAIFTGSSATSRTCVSRTNRITGVTAGTYTAKLRAVGGTGITSAFCNTIHTGLVVTVIEG